MNTAHELLDQMRRDGAARFAATSLAADHRPVVRRVRRDRAVRTSALSLAGVVAAGAAVFGVSQFSGTATPVGTPTPSPSSTSAPSPTPAVTAHVAVAQQDRIEHIAAALAAEYGTTETAALDAITSALPAEAGGNPEGWVIAGEYSFDSATDLPDAARGLTSALVKRLNNLGVPQDQWLDTVKLASIVQQEAPAGPSDQSALARVLVNRLEQGMMLQVESPLAYFLRADERPVSDDGWAVDTPYNTYMYEGLPPGAIGAFTPETLEAAANPADGDWLYFLRKPDGNVLVFTTFDEYAVAVDEYFPGTGASD